MYPTPHVVSLERHSGAGTDPLGNAVDAWDDPVDIRVIAYQPSAAVNTNGYESRIVSDVDLAVPPDLEIGARDYLTLPGWGRMSVVGFEDATRGFHGWRPGVVVKLKQVSG